MNTTATMLAAASGAQNARAILFGRFMLPDSTEHPCQVTRLSPEGAVFHTGIEPPAGFAIVAYIDGIGRVEAVTGEATEGGFAVSFQITGARRERIEARIRSLQESDGEADELRDRQHPPHEGSSSASHIALPDGRTYPCDIIDISTSGAVVTIGVLPALGTWILLGKMRGRIVRYLERGIAIDFAGQHHSAAPALHLR